MRVDLSLYFEHFLRNIELGQRQRARMDSAANAVAAFLTSSYELPEAHVFLQGSYANGSAIEPVDGGEYDVDLVAICAAAGASPTEALNDLEARFRADGRFRDRVKRKKPCVRLEYAGDDVGNFHVDVVPVRPDYHTLAPLESPRRDEGWRGTAPAEYTAWCQSQGDLFLDTVQILKRWRDEQQSVRQAIKSIVLQVLISQHMPQISDHSIRVAETLRSLHRHLSVLHGPPVVWNPALPTEDLASAWTADSFGSFLNELTEAVELVDQAARTDDHVEAGDTWRQLLGEDFPVLTPDQLGMSVGDFSHAQSPAEKGWAQAPDVRYGISISAERQRGSLAKTRRPYQSNGPTLFAGGNRLRFRAHVKGPRHVDVWWQVANTGAHARDQSGLRGSIFEARLMNGNRSNDETENWEGTAYTGSHLIRALAVRNNVVVASSDWFRVNIYAKGRPFRI